jgi:hypothetical protein
MKKTRGQKSRATVPLRGMYWYGTVQYDQANESDETLFSKQERKKKKAVQIFLRDQEMV